VIEENGRRKKIGASPGEEKKEPVTNRGVDKNKGAARRSWEARDKRSRGNAN